MPVKMTFSPARPLDEADDAPAWLQDAAAHVGLEAPSPTERRLSPSSDYVPFGSTPSGLSSACADSPAPYIAPDFFSPIGSHGGTPAAETPGAPGIFVSVRPRAPAPAPRLTHTSHELFVPTPLSHPHTYTCA